MINYSIHSKNEPSVKIHEIPNEAPEMTKGRAITAFVREQHPLDDKDLSDAIISDEKYLDVDFGSSNLSRVVFKNSNLKKIFAEDVEINDFIRFENCDIEKLELSSATINGKIEFISCRIKKLNLNSIDGNKILVSFIDSDVEDAQMMNMIVDKIECKSDEKRKWNKISFSGSDINKIEIDNIDITETSMSNAAVDIFSMTRSTIDNMEASSDFHSWEAFSCEVFEMKDSTLKNSFLEEVEITDLVLINSSIDGTNTFQSSQINRLEDDDESIFEAIIEEKPAVQWP